MPIPNNFTSNGSDLERLSVQINTIGVLSPLFVASSLILSKVSNINLSIAS